MNYSRITEGGKLAPPPSIKANSPKKQVVKVKCADFHGHLHPHPPKGKVIYSPTKIFPIHVQLPHFERKWSTLNPVLKEVDFPYLHITSSQDFNPIASIVII